MLSRSKIGILSAIFMCSVSGAADEEYGRALECEEYFRVLEQTTGLEHYAGNAALCDVELRGLFPDEKLVMDDLTKIRKAIKHSKEKTFAEFKIGDVDYLIESCQYERFPDLKAVKVIEAKRDPQLFYTPEVGLKGGRYWYGDEANLKSFIIQRKYPCVIANLMQAKRTLGIEDHVNGNDLIKKAETIASAPLGSDLTPEQRFINVFFHRDLILMSKAAAYRYVMKHSEEIKESDSPRKTGSWISGMSLKSEGGRKKREMSFYRESFRKPDKFFEGSRFSSRGGEPPLD